MVKKILKIVGVVLLVLILLFTGWLGSWSKNGSNVGIPVVYAADTGALTTTTMTAVTSSAGDNNGFETTYGTATPKDTTTMNAAGIESLNSGTAASTSCALPNTSSDQADFTNFNVSIPSGAVVTGITITLRAHYDSNSGTNTLCAFLSPDAGSSWTAGQKTSDINTGTATNFVLGSASDLWGRSSWTSSELGNTNFRLRLMTLVASVSRDAFIDYLAVTVYYNSPPNAPSLVSPSNNATDTSVTPTFQMSATDPDSDNLGYKVTIYSDSSCTTAVQTNDQSVSSTGWSGTDSTCTNGPTSCYTSGTQGTFLTQTPLSYGTQYWWKASAKDPDGTNTFTDSTGCNTFTTQAVIVSVVISSNSSIAYGYIAPGGGANTSTAGLNITPIATNNGNVAEDFAIAGTNSANWTLGAAAGNEVYAHMFCTASCISPPTNYTALTTSNQSLATNVAVNGTQSFDLAIYSPSSTANFSQQSVNVVITATQH